eukprot:4335311-Prymnesium_polylepis.1
MSRLLSNQISRTRRYKGTPWAAGAARGSGPIGRGRATAPTTDVMIPNFRQMQVWARLPRSAARL